MNKNNSAKFAFLYLLSLVALGFVAINTGQVVFMYINKYIFDAILCEENADLPYSFIRETLQAKAEIEAGFGQEYPFGILK